MSKKFLIIALIHLVLVIGFMVIFDYQLDPDSPRYIAVANEFAALNFQFSADVNCHTAPGYPFFLALIKLLTWHNMFLIAVAQAILFIISLWYFLSHLQLKYGFSNLAILLLSAFVLLNPEIIHLNGAVLTESLAASLILFVCGSLINEVKGKYDKYIFVLGFSFLSLTKMEYVLLAVVFIPFLFVIKQHKTILLTSATLLSLLSLNGLKNQNTYGVFKMTSFGSGTVIYGGNNLNLSGSWHMHTRTKNYVPDKYLSVFDSISKLDPVCSCMTLDSLYKEMALEAWKTSYTDQLKVIPVKLGKLWLLPGSMDFYTGQEKIYRGLQIDKLFSNELWPWYGKWKHGAYLLAFWFSLLLSIIGLYMKVKTYKLDRIDLMLISILLINTFMYSIPFYGIGRFHLPVISMLFYYAIYPYVHYENKKTVKGGVA